METKYYGKIKGHDVWVTVQRPMMLGFDGLNYIEGRDYIVDFEIEKPPKTAIRGYVREANGDLTRFGLEYHAANAGFRAAAARISRVN